MATMTMQVRAVGQTASGGSTPRWIDLLRIAAGTILATLLIIALMAIAGRMQPAHPEWAEPSPGGPIGLAAHR